MIKVDFSSIGDASINCAVLGIIACCIGDVRPN